MKRLFQKIKNWLLNRKPYDFRKSGLYMEWLSNRYFGNRYYYIPSGAPITPNPEDIKGVRDLPENEICTECKKPIWSCYCNIDTHDW